MPAAKPPEFRRRAVALARQGEQPVATIARDLGISVSCLRRWMGVDDVDAGRKGARCGKRFAHSPVWAERCQRGNATAPCAGGVQWNGEGPPGWACQQVAGAPARGVHRVAVGSVRVRR
jgi:hypothetical protein